MAGDGACEGLHNGQHCAGTQCQIMVQRPEPTAKVLRRYFHII